MKPVFQSPFQAPGGSTSSAPCGTVTVTETDSGGNGGGNGGGGGGVDLPDAPDVPSGFLDGLLPGGENAALYGGGALLLLLVVALVVVQ